MNQGFAPCSCTKMALAGLIASVFDKKDCQESWHIAWKGSLDCELERRSLTPGVFYTLRGFGVAKDSVHKVCLFNVSVG